MSKLRSNLAGAAALLLASASGAVQAEKWYFEPVFDARLGYDDNIRFTTDFEDAAFSAYLMADARFGVRTEVSDARFDVKLDTRRYDGFRDLDTSNQFFDMDLAFKPSGRHTLRLKGAYYNDSTRTSELLTTGYLARTVDRTYEALNPSWEWQASERLALQLGYSYTKSRYDDDRPFGLIDYRYDTATIGGAYQLSERTRLTGSLNYSMYDAQNVYSEYNSYWLQIGVEHQLTETVDWTLSLGPRYTEFDFSGPGGLKLSTDDSSYLAEFRLRKRYETLNIEGVLRSFENPSSSGRLLRTQAAELNLDGELSARTRYGLSTGFYRNRSTGGLEDPTQDRDYFFFEPRLSWRVTEWWTLSGSYRYRTQDYTSIDTGRATSNAVFLTLRYVWPRESMARWMAL